MILKLMKIKEGEIIMSRNVKETMCVITCAVIMSIIISFGIVWIIAPTILSKLDSKFHAKDYMTVTKKYTKENTLGQLSGKQGEYKIAGKLVAKTYYIIVENNENKKVVEVDPNMYHSIKKGNQVLCHTQKISDKVLKVELKDE